MDAVKKQYPELQAVVDSIVQLPGEHELNEQQKWIVAAALTGKDVIVRALAGTGKTSTLLAIARRMAPRAKRPLHGVQCLRAGGGGGEVPRPRGGAHHQLPGVRVVHAEGRAGKKYFDKLEKGMSGANDVARHVGISGSMYQRGRVVSDSAAVGVVQKAVQNYMVSADDELSMDHVKPLGLNDKNAFEVFKAANEWANYRSPEGS